MTDYVKGLNIGNSDQLFSTVAQYLSGEHPHRCQIIYLYGNGSNGKTVFLETLSHVIRGLCGHQIPRFPIPDLDEVTVFNLKLLVPSNLSKIAIAHIEDLGESSLENTLTVIERWSQMSGIHRCYFFLSNYPIVDQKLRDQVIYCEFPNRFMSHCWTHQQKQKAIESVNQHIKSHLTNTA